MSDVQELPDRPLLSLVISVYGVEDYLPAFLHSLDQVDADRSQVELIFVDDGSPDGSRALVEAWVATTDLTVEVLVKDNGGLSSARNLGLAHARGTWVSFPDPDDVLSPHYLRDVAAFVQSSVAEGVSLVATRMVPFVGDPSSPSSRHSLDFKFDQPARVVDLVSSPRYVHVHAATAFYRLDVVRAAGLTFDERVSPVFEDGVFTGMYLLEHERPTSAFLGLTEYYYRKRETQDSLTDTAWSRPGRYDAILEHGHLALVARSGDPVPPWLQHMIFYDLQWYTKADSRNASPTASVDAGTLERFFELLDQILTHLDEGTILDFMAARVPLDQRYAFLARKNGRFTSDEVSITRLDAGQEIQQLRYFTHTPVPDERILVDGVAGRAVFAKTTALTYFGRPWLYQRDLWVTALEPVALEVDGRPRRIRLGGPHAEVREALPSAAWRRFHGRQPPDERDWTALSVTPDVEDQQVEVEAVPAPQPARGRAVDRARARVSRVLRRQVGEPGPRPVAEPVRGDTDEIGGDPAEQAETLKKRSRTAKVRSRYADAWVLMDRDTLAQDNAEAMYRYLRREQPQVNAWFVLRRDAPDWDRLSAEGFRLVDHGTPEHVLLLLNAKYLLSSQIDHYVVQPYDSALYPPRRWKYVFLQHGVTKDDLSRWINHKPIRLMITATAAEQASIVGDCSPYRWSEREVALTGFPRHDSLLAKARGLGPGARRDLVVMPTWRDQLLEQTKGSNARVLRPGFEDSAYARAWFGLLRSPELAELAERAGVRVVFAPHPNLEDHVTAGDLPPHVHLARYRDHDIQEVIAAARLMVTDYSSLAFEAAYVGTPVVYYQFDADEFFAGTHAYRRGYFSYERDGFGPVVDTQDDLLKALRDLLDPEHVLPEEYRERIEQTFPFRDGQNSRRVYEAVCERERSAVRDLPALQGP